MSTALHKYANFVNCQKCTGNDLINSKNARASFSGHDLEDVAYMFRTPSIKDSMDVTGGSNTQLVYESAGAGISFSSVIRFNVHGAMGGYNQNIQYTAFCGHCSHLFGCIGLRDKSYYILNKQYAKEEYEKLVPRIIKHMNTMPYTDNNGRIYTYGEFFPSVFSSFSYNETVAQEYFPLTKEQALSQGYSWKDPDRRDYKITRKPEELPDHIEDVNEKILTEVIGCVHEGKCLDQCTTAFKIIQPELQFYKKMNLPLPRLCPNCRHYERLTQRNPLKLWHRKCQCAGAKSENGVYTNTAKHQHNEGHCQNEFETSYAPDRKEIVYCEQCYQAEVV